MLKRQEIVARVRLKIILHDFLPGENVPEESLAAEFRVSRTPIRESLLKLEDQRLVAIETNRGAKVASITLGSMRSFFEAAIIVYGKLLTLAAVRTSAENLDALRVRVSEIERLSDGNSAAPRTEAVLSMMDLICASSGNHFLIDSGYCLSGYHSFIRNGVLKDLPGEDRRRIEAEEVAHFRNILAALESRDSDAATEAVGLMLDSSRAILIANFI